MAAPTTPSSRRDVGPAGLRLVQPPRRRTPWIVLGVLLVAGSALGFGAWSSSLAEREAVVVAARDIEAGATIGAGDLRTARVAVEGRVASVSAAQRRAVVGRVAVAAIPRGALLHPAHLADGVQLPAGESVVGVALPPGAVPTPNLRVGDHVQVVLTAAADRDDGPSGVVARAVVFAVRDLDDAARTVVVSLRVASPDAPAVAAAAGTDRVRLVLLGRDGS